MVSGVTPPPVFPELPLICFSTAYTPDTAEFAAVKRGNYIC